MLPFALVAILLQSPASDARQVALSAIQIVTEVDAGKLKGDLVRLAWSPDGRQFYLQTIERDSHGNVKQARHYVVSTASRDVKSAEGEPDWASQYWTWKSAQASPAVATFKIDVSSRQETVRSTAAPTGGALAKGGAADPAAGSTLQDVASAADTAQVQNINGKFHLRMQSSQELPRCPWSLTSGGNQQSIVFLVNILFYEPRKQTTFLYSNNLVSRSAHELRRG